eukprot:CAMPEP_0204149776 /NCGR_PEP_ID=MMETSP0361-20130328/24695_1 /ASSEMBLY_ACC=CAM_ASM_000343 /TAXON_ID=268821 /ORGANISM="Scrippsiella Hangoei, Strain SHTV-5" /LENGTH=185 /DNA_ID=CAMNT_0051104341 /DNA_START=230 /DNA_END=788 /DNA_ORIENTATION=-
MTCPTKDRPHRPQNPYPAPAMCTRTKCTVEAWEAIPSKRSALSEPTSRVRRAVDARVAEQRHQKAEVAFKDELAQGIQHPQRAGSPTGVAVWRGRQRQADLARQAPGLGGAAAREHTEQPISVLSSAASASRAARTPGTATAAKEACVPTPGVGLPSRQALHGDHLMSRVAFPPGESTSHEGWKK